MISKITATHQVFDSEGNGTFTLTDLQSLNGTFVNDQKMERPQRVGRGDVIRLGEFAMILQDK